jgi:hypothetical protein
MDSHKTKAEKARHVPLAVVMRFLGQTKELEWSFDFIFDQLRLVDEGVRDVRLHDETCKLLLSGGTFDDVDLDDMREDAIQRWGPPFS